MSFWEYPLQTEQILRNYKKEKKRLSLQSYETTLRIAVLGASTTGILADLWGVFLMQRGIGVQFYEGEYGRCYEEAVFANEKLTAFAPDIIYLHDSCRTLKAWPSLEETEEEVAAKIETQVERWQAMWQGLRAYACTVIQNNLEWPQYRLLGNLDAVDYRGHVRYVQRLNEKLWQLAQEQAGVCLHDLQYLASQTGLERWYDDAMWYAYRQACSMDGIVALAHSLAVTVQSLYGKSKKCLVTDLDNTLWGGVIGDDGQAGLQLGEGSPQGEAYLAVQRYLDGLRRRGVVLAVASKNEAENAKLGLAHPESLLDPKAFALVAANWEPKPQNLQEIAKTLALGLESFVFLDDNPVERQHVQERLPQVAVPKIGADPTWFVRHLDRNRYFEPAVLVQEDLQRAEFYRANVQRQETAVKAGDDYESFLRSLQMRATIGAFSPIYLERIAQLINKTNQFNLTTRRYAQEEVARRALAEEWVTLYGRLEDCYGDNGIVTALMGRRQDDVLYIDTWVMSCRVLKRHLEHALFETLLSICAEKGITCVLGEYIETPKNKMVASLYQNLGFLQQENTENTSWWELKLPRPAPGEKHKVMEVICERENS